MQTDDLAAQMVREMLSEIEKQGAILVNYAPILEPIARRYIEKAVAIVAPDAFHDGYAAASATRPMTADIKALVERGHRKVMTDVALGKWLSAALDDPNICEEMKADIRAWFSSGEPLEEIVAQQASSLTAQAEEIERLRGELRRIAEGNLGDASWQANYEKIRDVARAALKAAQEVKA